MIQALLFDLDGTLVQTEKLKALSYAKAAQRLLGLDEPDQRAIEAYRVIVGSERDVASRFVMDQLGLESPLRKLAHAGDEVEPAHILTTMRKSIYDEMVADPQVLRDNQWPYSVDLLRVAKEAGCRTALATMSHRDEALHVLRSLDLERSLDVILSRDDVSNPKPDPEIYLKATRILEVDPSDCLILEDSPMGVRAGVASGAHVVAIATPFTTAGLHRDEILPHVRVVHEPEDLLETVRHVMEHHDEAAHRPVSE